MVDFTKVDWNEVATDCNKVIGLDKLAKEKGLIFCFNVVIGECKEYISSRLQVDDKTVREFCENIDSDKRREQLNKYVEEVRDIILNFGAFRVKYEAEKAALEEKYKGLI